MTPSEHQIRRSATHLRVRFGRLFIVLFALPFLGVGGSRASAQQAETRRILAIRVSFPVEAPNEETTSGDGTFDLRSFEVARPDYRFPFDTPPHGRSYFSAHLQALAHYFDTNSGGRLRIEFDVLPPGESDSYALTRRLIDYGNGRTRQEINARIVELFRDGILIADKTEGASLDFANYDDIIVIHAGLGGESSNQLNDIPSAFINKADLDTYAEGPIPVDGGSRSVDQGILLPEAGGTDGRSGLNGILARFYANQLGLPRLDNPEDGLPAIGDWSLMDTGNITVASSNQLGFNNLTGNPSDTILVAYAPSLLTAWSRERLGWLTPTVVRHDTILSIAAAHSVLDYPKAVRIPITADEYFLLENRMSRLAVEGRRPNITLSEGTRGVWIANDDYDAFIPGSGILIWHIDDAVIKSSGETKAVNSNPDFRIHFDGLVGLYRKGVALEEADGLEDIGNTSASRVITSGFISFASISGNNQDPFYVGNVTRFGPDTTPNSNSNVGHASGVEIEILSAPGEVMDVSIRFIRHQDRWPRVLNTVTRTVAPRSTTAAGPKAILNGGLTTDENAWSLSGNTLNLPNYKSLWTPAIGNVRQTQAEQILFSTGRSPLLWSDGQRLTAADVAGPSTAPVSAAPVVAVFPGNASNDIWGHQDGTVTWGIFGPEPGEAYVGSGAIVGISVGNVDSDDGRELVALNEHGSIYIIEGHQTVTLLGTVENVRGTPVIANLDGVGPEEIVVLSTDGSVTIFVAGEEPVTSRPVPGGAASPPVLSDIDGDGFVEILFGGDSRIWITRFNGVAQTGTPHEIPLKDRAGRLEAPPVIADLDDDGDLDILVASQTGAIYALSNTGVSLPGFPILATGPISVSLLVDDLDNDNLLELVAFTDDGAANLWHIDQIDPSLTGSTVSWGQMGGGPGNTGSLSQTLTPVDSPSLSDLLPKARAYCYPNPIRGNIATIRYYLSDEAAVELLIINAVGQIVDRITATRTDARTDNEIRWDTTDYGSGIYICRLQATDGSRTETRFIKAAIIR